MLWLHGLFATTTTTEVSLELLGRAGGGGGGVGIETTQIQKRRVHVSHALLVEVIQQQLTPRADVIEQLLRQCWRAARIRQQLAQCLDSVRKLLK